jgi:hypothetical protein
MSVCLLNFAKNNKIPVIILGGTPFEGLGYKTNIVKTDPNGGMESFLVGYLSQIIRNPKWILNYNCLITQIKEFYYYFYPGRKKLAEKVGISIISPFAFHIRWEEREVISTIERELNWRQHPNLKSTWRGDCEVGMLRDYLFKKTLGFNDKDDHLSCLIRDNQISREEALKRLKKEGEIPENSIKELFDKLGLDYSDLKIALSKYEQKKS